MTSNQVLPLAGAAKLLAKLAVEGTEGGRTHAAHALAKIATTMDPNIAFPGQRMYEIVRPLLLLLDLEKDGIQNYEALLALTNLASVSDSVRNRILKEKAIPKIEEYWFMQEHEQLRAAAAELLLNLMHNTEGLKLMRAEGSDRMKLWLLYTGEEDERLARAATAACVLLTNDCPDAVKRLVTQCKSWLEVLQELAIHDDEAVQERGLLLILNFLEVDYEIAAQMMASKLLEELIAVSKITERPKAQKIAQQCLDAAAKFDVIKPTDRQLFERSDDLQKRLKDAVVPTVVEEEEPEG